MTNELGRGDISAHVFTYDAWSHQGDPLRRAFLDDLIVSLKSGDLLSSEESEEATKKIWNRLEITKTISEPILRNHAKITLLSAAFIPIGMKMFEVPQIKIEIPPGKKNDFWELLFSSRNILGVIIILLPLIMVGLFAILNWIGINKINNWLFGKERDKKLFSVMSFFLQKVEGSVEKKQIKSPADTIMEFKEVFNDLIDKAYARRPNKKIIIVIDNIDRIPAEHARNFWATMQTFFADPGGVNLAQRVGYWLVAPFSVDALTFVFSDSGSAAGSKSPKPAKAIVDGASDVSAAVDEASARARAFIDKTFALAFFVPPPILTNWREYLLRQLAKAFPQHDESDRFAVQDIFDLARGGTSVPITPREVKLFVNGLVTIYRQHAEIEDTIPLAAMAAYLLHREEIGGMTIPSDLLTPTERRHIGGTDWRVSMAALHFGVHPTVAEQIVLQEPILAALRAGSSSALKNEEKRPGFYDVLRILALTEAEKHQDRADGVWYAQIAATVGGLQEAEHPKLGGFWNSIRGLVRNASDWENFRFSPADGLRFVLDHTGSIERPPLCAALANSISRSPMPGPESLATVQDAATNWIATAMVILEANAAKAPLGIAMPGKNHFQLEIIQQLAELKTNTDLRAGIKVSAGEKELNASLAEFVRTRGLIRYPTEFVPFVVETLKFPADWSAIANSSVERLRATDISASEANSLVRLLLALVATGHQDALAALGNLSREGHLAHLLHVHRSDSETRAAILTATLLANPSLDRPSQVAESPQGDGDLNRLLDLAEFDQTLIKAIAGLVVAVRAEATLFVTGSKHDRISGLVASIIASVVDSGTKIDIEPAQVAERRSFLEKHPAILAAEKFVSSLKQKGELLTLLAREPFEIERSFLYLATIKAQGEVGHEYRAFLQEQIGALKCASWEQALAAQSGPHLHLVELCSHLRSLGSPVELTFETYDALRAQVRKIAEGSLPTSSDAIQRFETVLDLLRKDQQPSLMHEIVADMANIGEVQYISRTIEFVGSRLVVNRNSSASYIIQRIFTPIVSQPTGTTVKWVLSTIESQPDFFAAVDVGTRDAISARLEAAKAREGVPTDVSQTLEEIARRFGATSDPKAQDIDGGKTAD